MLTLSETLNFIDYSRAELNMLKLEYSRCTDNKTITADLPVKIKNFLENLRSSLDASAKILYEKFGDRSNQPKIIHFPYAWIGATEAEFDKKVDMYLPGIKSSRPDIYQLLNSYQYYQEEDNIWLPAFMELAFENNHDKLAIEAVDDVDQVGIGFGIPGAGLIVRGEGVIEMEGNAIIESEHGSIQGEQSISVQTHGLTNKKGNITSGIDKDVCIIFEVNNQEVIFLLDEILNGVSRIITDLAGIK